VLRQGTVTPTSTCCCNCWLRCASCRPPGGCPPCSCPRATAASWRPRCCTSTPTRARALPQLHDALAALLDAFGETEWGRVLPDLAARLAAPLGPSHRAALGVLLELPATGASGRACALQRAGGMQLLHRLVRREPPVSGARGKCLLGGHSAPRGCPAA
jgi:hypothetical protein